MRGRTVLLLNKEPASKQVTRRALEDAGYTVYEASNGLRLVSRLDVDRPDVVVMDTAQAWADCFDLCRSLKSSARFGRVRVVLMADDDSQGERARLACCDRLVSRAKGTGGLIHALGELFDGVNQAGAL
jgi:CheY-like chemotaxis protein